MNIYVHTEVVRDEVRTVVQSVAARTVTPEVHARTATETLVTNTDPARVEGFSQTEVIYVSP